MNGVPQVIDAARNRIEKDYLTGNYEFSLIDNNKITLAWIPIQAAQDRISQDWARRYTRGVEIAEKGAWFQKNKQLLGY